MRKVIITGGTGFIGSHITEKLANQGYQITVLDDLSTGKLANIEALLERPNTEFVQGSVTDITLLQRIFRDAYYVFHQAAIPSVPRSIENPQASHDINVTGTLNVLLAARDNDVKKVIYASSSSVYGDTPTLPKVEDMIPNPQSPYAVTKLAGEYYCRVFEQVYNLPTVCLRYFNVYGPRQDPDSHYAAVVPLFISRVSQGKPPIIFGDGKQTRDFTYISDVVEANILAAESNASGVFNIGGGGNQVSLEKLARLVPKLMGKNIDPIYEKPRPGDIRHSLADISRAKTFGYKPEYNLEEGIKETIRGFQYAK
ncbi:SDR family oxidoreductase [Chloroflexota bacterium]